MLMLRMVSLAAKPVDVPTIRLRACSRRFAVATAVAALPLPLSASTGYLDAAAAMEQQFAQQEAARAQQNKQSIEARRKFELKVDELTSLPRTPERFIAASDALALCVIGEGRIPEGVSVQVVVARVRAAYNRLPTYPVECERRDRADSCVTHGAAVEAAYSALLRELKKYAGRSAYAQSGGYELPNTPFSF